MVWQKMPNPRGPPCQASMLLTAAVALLAKASCSKASFFMTTVLGRC